MSQRSLRILIIDENAIRGGGFVSVEQIGKALSAGTNCGSCVPELKGLLAESAAAPR